MFDPGLEIGQILKNADIVDTFKYDVIVTMQKLTEWLVPGGIFYASFKYGEFSGERNGRFFTDMTEDTFKAVLSKVQGLTIVKQMITEDARPDRSEKWLNVFLKKVNPEGSSLKDCVHFLTIALGI